MWVTNAPRNTSGQTWRYSSANITEITGSDDIIAGRNSGEDACTAGISGDKVYVLKSGYYRVELNNNDYSSSTAIPAIP